MQIKYKITIVVICLATAFALGRYTVPTKIKIVEIEKKTEDKNSDTNKKRHKQVIVKKVSKPDGETEVTTITTDDIGVDKKLDDKKIDDIEKSKEVTHAADKVTVSALGGLDFTTYKPVYGASLTKPVLGPLTVGAWFLTNPSCGLSIGLTF